jgi:hypothetical protein
MAEFWTLFFNLQIDLKNKFIFQLFRDSARGAGHLIGKSLKVAWAILSTPIWAVLLSTYKSSVYKNALFYN